MVVIHISYYADEKLLLIKLSNVWKDFFELFELVQQHFCKQNKQIEICQVYKSIHTFLTKNIYTTIIIMKAPKKVENFPYFEIY